MKEWEIIEQAIEIGTACGVKTWLDLKKMLLVSLPSTEREKFSTRDPVTKKQNLNKFERQIINNYEKKTGVELEVPIGT
jgi:hypothetical protein